MLLQVLVLVRGCAPHIHTTHGWTTVCALIQLTELGTEAGPKALQALAAAAAADTLTAPAFLPVLETAAIVVERHKVGGCCLLQEGWVVCKGTALAAGLLPVNGHCRLQVSPLCQGIHARMECLGSD